MKILIYGVTGMLGHTLYKEFFSDKYPQFTTYGTARSLGKLYDFFTPKERSRIWENVSADNFSNILDAMKAEVPDIVINCIGVIKQRPDAKDPLMVIPINSVLPHYLASLCRRYGSKLIHISTDCVFSGKKGNYKEDDISDTSDLYGKSKYMGEVLNSTDMTIRTSIIGHELRNCYGLAEWFFAQKERTGGYVNAIYTGFPTIELARIIAEYVIPNNLTGLYHVSSNRINKYNILVGLAQQYGMDIDIEPLSEPYIDMSLDSTRFKEATGYTPPNWKDLIRKMYEGRYV